MGGWRVAFSRKRGLLDRDPSTKDAASAFYRPLQRPGNEMSRYVIAEYPFSWMQKNALIFRNPRGYLGMDGSTLLEGNVL
jgi:hypothetical protein